MGLRTVPLGVWFLGLSLVACGDDDTEEEEQIPVEPELVLPELATFLCQASEGCDCTERPADPATCADAIGPVIAGLVSAGQSLGLQYREECLEPATAYAQALGCRGGTEAENDPELTRLAWEVSQCKMMVGEGQLGDRCIDLESIDFLNLGDTCAQGLTCFDFCYELVETPGEPCSLGFCPPGTACVDHDADGIATCEAPRAAGEPCNPHRSACSEDLVCDPTALVCAEPPGPGEACPLGRCSTGSTCEGGQCQALPEVGEPCTPYCAPGLRCEATTYTCAPPALQGESCFYPEDCADGLTCSPDTSLCAPLPAEGESCPNGYCAAGLICSVDYECTRPIPRTCDLPFCLYQFDGLCDEPEGTGFCQEGTDPADCTETTPPA